MNLIASGAGAAIALVKAYVGKPVIVFGGISVPIECFRYVPKMEADVSTKVIIDLTGKKKVTDNVAPGPHEWHLEGYVGGIPFEFSSLFMPSIGIMRDNLEQAFLSRQPLDFFDADQKGWTLAGGHPVQITTLEFEKLPDTENRLVVRVDLRELYFLSAQVSSISPQDVVAQFAQPDAGGTSGGVPASTGAHESVTEVNPAAPTTSWGTQAQSLSGDLR